MDCKDCINYDDCLLQHTGCRMFKQKDQYLKSPVIIGSTVYLVNKWKDGTAFIQEAPVVGLHLRDKEDYRGLKREEYMVTRPGYGYTKSIPFRDIGKRVFLDKEEAEETVRDCMKTRR